MRPLSRFSQSSKTTTSYSLNKSVSSYQLPHNWSESVHNYGLQKSLSTSSVIESHRGFKPSDSKDPAKKEFLAHLTKRVFKVGLDESISKPINLEKIFTPAKDAHQIMPQKNKKMFASSDFYAKGLHPTMEEQVELARRISSSLSDVNNQTSKGQSMYVNRKKRSVKWVHEGEGKANGTENGFGVEGHDENKPLLTLVMNPRGKLQDIYSLRKQGYNIDAALSPEFCQEIVRDLNSPRGKGAELFAKRRKRSEKWVVGETEGTRPAYDTYTPTPKPVLVPVLPPNNLPTPSYLPETAQRVQHNQKLDQIQEQYVRPRVKLLQSPWNAALETGSVEAAFEDLAPVWPKRGNFVKPTVDSYEHALKTDTLESWDGSSSKYAPNSAYNSNSINRMVDNFQKGVSNVDVYKPKLPRSWNSLPPPQQYSSVASLINPPLEPAITASPSPFPTIPDVIRISKENLLETKRDVDLSRLISPLPPQEPNQDQNNRVISPFKRIHDIETDLEVLQDDIAHFKAGTPITSCFHPIMSFPTIPNISINPEIIEKDIVTLRTTPVPVTKQESISTDDIVPVPREILDLPFPAIPDFSIQSCAKPFSRGFPTRSYAPVSLTDKKYSLNLDPRPKTPVLKPEFNFALDNNENIIERDFNEVQTVRSLQSEIFESQGHFNASGSCSPYSVFIPKSPVARCELENVHVDAQDTRKFSERVKDQFTKQCNSQYAQLEDANEVKKMLVKMKHVQFGIDHLHDEAADESLPDGSNMGIGYNEESPQLKSESTLELGEETKTEVSNKSKSVENNQNFSTNESDKNIIVENLNKVVGLKNEPSRVEIAHFQTCKDLRVEKRPVVEIESPKCKKPPQSVAGARPLFGHMDINAEIKKALVGKMAQHEKSNDHPATEPKVKIERSEIKTANEYGDNTKMMSELKTTEIAEVKTIAKTDEMEIEQVYYERKRELDMDLEIKQEELVMADGTVVPIVSSSHMEYFPKMLLQGDTNQFSDSKVIADSKQLLFARACENVHESEELYHKVPVKSLIQSFEQSTMPPLRYKQIKDVAVVQSVVGNQVVQQGIKREQLLKQAEEDFENLYCITNSSTETFQQSENSSFCKYSTDEFHSNALPPASDGCTTQGQPRSPLPASPVNRPTLVRTPSYKAEASPTIFVPKENQYTAPSYELYNVNQSASTQPPPPRKYGNFNNYNTAPRGWGQSPIYKPINFTDYSDF